MTNSKHELEKRLTSLDAFRGFAIALMIFVNNAQGNTYHQLHHALWNGWTIADTVFPFFLWITGVTIVFSLGNRLKKNSKKEILFHIAKRVIILIILGIFLNAFPFFHLAGVRIPGVLQRIAVCYFIASIIYIFTGIRGVGLSTLIILTAYWILIKVFGDTFPQSVDTFLLNGHLWSKGFDPEGIVSSIAATSTVFFGIITGYFLKRINNENKKIYLLISFGVVLIFLGLTINTWLPINKNLWTSSYSIFMSGVSGLIYSLFYYLIEKKGLRKLFQIFTVYGMNPLFIYILSSLFTSILWLIPVRNLKIINEKNAIVLFAVANVILFYIVANFLYRRKWFLKI